jgi:hypothetical protein
MRLVSLGQSAGYSLNVDAAGHLQDNVEIATVRPGKEIFMLLTFDRHSAEIIAAQIWSPSSAIWQNGKSLGAIRYS